MKAKLGVVEGVQAWVNVALKVSASAHMAMAISFLLSYSSAQLTILLEVTLHVYICISAVLKVVTTLPSSK